MAGYDPYASLGFKGKKAKRRSDVAVRRLRKLRQDAEAHPTSPGAKAYLRKNRAAPQGTAQQRREKKLVGLRLGTHRLKGDRILRTNQRVRQQKILADIAAREAKKDGLPMKVLKALPIAAKKVAKTAMVGPLLSAADEVLDKDNAKKKKVLATAAKGVAKGDKDLTKFEKDNPRMPGVGANALGLPSLKQLHQGAKSLWYSGNIINSGIYNSTRGEWKKIPSEAKKASQGKATYSGKKVIGEKWAKRHGALGTVLGGVEEFAAETPAAIATGGSGTAAKQAGRTVATKALTEAVEAEVKKTGAKNAKKLSKEALAAATAKADRAGRVAERKVASRQGNTRDFYVGIDTKIPFTNRKIEKLVPMTTLPNRGRMKLRAKLNNVEARGTSTAARIGRMRDRANNTNRTMAGGASRHRQHDEVLYTERAGRKAREASTRGEREARDMSMALDNYFKKHKIGTEQARQKHLAEKFAEMEKNGPDSVDPMVRELFRALDAPHAEKVARGIGREWTGQRLVGFDYKKAAVSAPAKKGRQQVRDKTLKGKAPVAAPGRARLDKAITAQADKAAKNLPKTQKRLDRAKVDLALEQRQRDAVLTTHMRSQARAQKFAWDDRGIAQAEGAAATGKVNRRVLAANDERITKAQASLSAAEGEVTAASALATAGQGAKKAITKRADRRAKALYDDLVREIKTANPTADLADTQKTLEGWAARADALGAPTFATRLRRIAKVKEGTPKYRSPRPRMGANPIEESSSPYRTIGTRVIDDDKARVLRTQTATAAEKTNRYDFGRERVSYEIAANRKDVAESDFWRDVGRVIPGEPKTAAGSEWYTIGRHGLQRHVGEREAINHAKKLGNGTRHVRLSKATVEDLKRTVAIHDIDVAHNPLSRFIRKGNSVYKGIAIKNPTTQMKNVPGDAMRGVAISGGRPGRYMGKAVAGATAEARRSRTMRTMQRFTQEGSKGGRFSTEALEKKLSNPVTLGYGKNRRQTTLGDELDEFIHMGGAGSGMVRGDVAGGRRVDQSVKEMMGGTKFTKANERIDDAISFREFTQRFNTYLSLKAQNYTPTHAIEATMSGHIDYMRVSPFQEWGRRGALPFVVFRTQNLATYAGKLARKPGRIPRYQTVFDTMAQLAGFNDWKDITEERGSLYNTLPIPTAGGRFHPGLPIGDLLNTYKNLKSGDPSAVSDSVILNRQIVELAKQMDNKVNDDSLKPIPGSAAKAIQKAGLSKRFRMVYKSGPDGKKRWHAHPAVVALLQSTPEGAAYTRSAGTGSELSALNFFTGASYAKEKRGGGELERLSRQIGLLEAEVKDTYGAVSTAETKKLYKEIARLKVERKKLYAKRGENYGKPAPSSSGSSGGFSGGGGFSEGTGF